MKTKTELLLEAIAEFRARYSEYPFKQFYDEIDDVIVPSLRKALFQYDIEKFTQVNEILTVIMSIATHPFVNNKKEEAIVKSGLATNISVEALQRTMSDSKLWEKHNGEMLPREVYYYQYYDELKTYENIFIISVLEEIATHLEKRRVYYTEQVHTIDINDPESIKDNSLVEQTILLINKSMRKIARIQKTQFYKVVSKAPRRIKEVTPTNILVQNPYYNRVFKFYKDVIVKNDGEKSQRIFTTYFFVLLLKQLHRLGLDYLGEDYCVKSYDFVKTPLDLDFESKQLKINIKTRYEVNALEITIIDKDVDFTNKYLLISDVDFSFQDAYIPEDEKFTAVLYLSPRRFAHLENGQIVAEKHRHYTKETLMGQVFNSLHLVAYGSEEIYSEVCPCCQSQHLDVDNNVYRCLNCDTTYKITEEKGQTLSKITFGYIRGE